MSAKRGAELRVLLRLIETLLERVHCGAGRRLGMAHLARWLNTTLYAARTPDTAPPAPSCELGDRM